MRCALPWKRALLPLCFAEERELAASCREVTIWGSVRVAEREGHADPMTTLFRGSSRQPYANLVVRSLSLFLIWSVIPAVDAEMSHPELLQRIAFGSCANQNVPQPIWDDIIAAKPDLFLFVGDNIYADTEDMSVMSAKYVQLAAQSGYARLRAMCPVLATWDDHDYGVNDGDARYPKKAEAQKIMLDFFGVPKDAPQRRREGVYQAAIYGPPQRRVQVILLDTRYFKSVPTRDTRAVEEKKRANVVGWYVPNTDPSTTMLGAEQWRWLERQLREPAEVRLIVSSMQVIADAKGMESWGNFPHERQRLYELIRTTGAQGVCFLSGDVHFSEISRSDEGAYPLFDFTSSGLTNSSENWAGAVNPQRVSDRAYAKPTFGMVAIDWAQSPVAITFRAVGLRGFVAFEKTISVPGSPQKN
jgi:alkaline phosphatase D